MHSKMSLVCLVTVVVLNGIWSWGTPLAFAAHENKVVDEPHNFFVVTEAVSDASPFWFGYILDVKITGTETVVRSIRIAASTDYCPEAITVKAVEKRMNDPTLINLMHRKNLCSIKKIKWEESLNHAMRGGAVEIDDTARHSVVVDCSSGRRTYLLPYPEEIDLKKLKRDSPEVFAIWNLRNQIDKRVFGE